MSVFSRYVFRQTSSAVIMILTTLIIIIWVSVALKEIDLMTNEGQSAGIFFYITILALPQIIGVVMPVALLIACIHALNRLSGDSEIIVMTASGAGRWQLAKPLLALGFIVLLLVVANNAYVQPLAMRELRDYTIKVRTDLISHVLQPGRFTSPMGDLTFHIRARDPNGDILGFLLHDTRNPEQEMTYMADRSRLVEKNGTTYMVMYKGHIFRRANKGEGAQIIEFETYVFDLSQFEGNAAQEVHYKTYESYIGELMWPDPNNLHYQKRPGTFRAELHDRLSNPLYPLLYVLIAVSTLGYARTTRENRMRSIATAFVFAAVARLGGLSAVNMLAKNESAVFLVWGIPLGGMLAAAYVIQTRGFSQKFWRRRSQRGTVQKGAAA